MSSYIDDDDECDSSFVYRQRIRIAQQQQQQQKESITDNTQEEEQPLNLSLKQRSSDERIAQPIFYSAPLFNIKQEVHEESSTNAIDLISRSNIKREDNDSDNDSLTELSWLSTYNLAKDLKLTPLGSLSPADSEYDDEADGAASLHRPRISSFIPATLLQNMLVTHTKPPYSYSCLIFMAIESSQKKRITVKEVYAWILGNFPYFRSIPSGSWKNSIRHNLSHNRCFKKIDKNLLASRDFSGKGSLWCVNPDCRMTLIETLKKMPQKAYSILEDVPEAHVMQQQQYRAPNSSRLSKSAPKITSVSTKLIQRQQKMCTDASLIDCYKKACNDMTLPQNGDDCSDFDAASALLMFKSHSNANEATTSTSSRKKGSKISQVIMKATAVASATAAGTSPSKKRSLSEAKSSGNKKSRSSSQTPCPNDDHTYSHALKKQQQEFSQSLSNENTNTQNRRKGRKKSDPSKVVNVDDLNNFSDSYSFNSDSEYFDYPDSDEASRGTNASDSISNVSADTLRNALLELSRAAELIEDKEDDDDAVAKTMTSTDESQ